MTLRRRLAALGFTLMSLFAACGPVQDNDIGNDVGDVFEDVGEGFGEGFTGS